MSEDHKLNTMSAAISSREATTKPAAVNQYTGFTLPSSQYALDEVDVSKLGTRWFWDQYINKRKPCLLVGTMGGFHGDRWSNS